MIWLIASEMEEAGVTVWKDWKYVKPVCVKFTVLLGRRLDCDVGERALCEFLLMTVEVDRMGAWRDGKSGH
jgi:hypothetical protein